MSFTIAHITDPHLSPAPMPGLADLRLKRVMGFINWKRGRARLNDMGMLARLVADLRAQRPDHVAVTGDLVNIGMPAEFNRAALWMKTLGEAADVSFVPGNHDAYVRASMPLLEATFAPWTAGDAPRGEATYPYLRVRGGIAIIGLSSAVPTGPLMATGSLGKRQLEAFAELLGEPREGAGAGRAHPPPADRRRHAAAARPIRRGAVRGNWRATWAAEAICMATPMSRPSARSLARRAHGSGGGSGSSARHRPRPPPATRAIAPPIIWCASIATASGGGSASARAGSRRKAWRSASGRRCGFEMKKNNFSNQLRLGAKVTRFMAQICFRITRITRGITGITRGLR